MKKNFLTAQSTVEWRNVQLVYKTVIAFIVSVDYKNNSPKSLFEKYILGIFYMETLDSGAYKVASSVNGCCIMILFV